MAVCWFCHTDCPSRTAETGILICMFVLKERNFDTYIVQEWLCADFAIQAILHVLPEQECCFVDLLRKERNFDAHIVQEWPCADLSYRLSFTYCRNWNADLSVCSKGKKFWCIYCSGMAVCWFCHTGYPSRTAGTGMLLCRFATKGKKLWCIYCSGMAVCWFCRTGFPSCTAGTGMLLCLLAAKIRQTLTCLPLVDFLILAQGSHT